MQPKFTLLTSLAGALLLSFSACKKSEIPVADAETSSNATGRAGFANYNRNLTFYALSAGNTLDKYSTSIPKRMLGSAPVSGLSADDNLLSIDFRPATGQLYGITSSSRIVVIQPTTGIARYIGATPFSPAINGSIVAFDFNPTVDRIRIITSSGQNLRANPETGAIVATDGNINGQAGAIITGAGYTNNAAGVTSTTLYDIDKVSNNLYTQVPPNNGTLNLVGSLGLDVEDGEFDIAGATDAFGLFNINNKSTLIAVDLSTGQANIITPYPVTYKAFAIATSPVAYAADGNNNLHIFNPSVYYSEANLNTIISKPITGLSAGDSIRGIDFRPANGQLYALGKNGNIYTINTASAAATLSATLSVPLTGNSFGFDFNPVVDRIRIISNAGQNLRFNPADGTVIQDLPINPSTAAVSGAAYTNNFAGTTSTILYGLDITSNQLVQIAPPNNGTLVPVGVLPFRADAANGFDIGGTSGNAYALTRLATNNRSRVYQINLSTGAASGGSIIGTANIQGFAIGLGF